MTWLKFLRNWSQGSRRMMTNQHAHPTPPQGSRSLLPGSCMTSKRLELLLTPIDLDYDQDLFNYTRGCFVCDNELERSQRQVRFNVNELARKAAEAVGAKTCIKIAKYPDGMYNKSMLLTMDDGSRVVAKVPNPNAGRPHLTTASEVATMNFARAVLEIPVPKVLAWCSQAHETPVGAEYIIMEEVPGVQIEEVWPRMSIEDRFAIVKSVAGYQKIWTSVSFTKYGSLYFAKDLNNTSRSQPLYIDTNGDQITNEQFAIGPTTSRETFDNGRGEIEFDTGPCKWVLENWKLLWLTPIGNSLEAYHLAIGQREMACIRNLAKLPKSPITLCGPGTYQPTKMKKLKALNCYLDLVKHLLPSDPQISSAHLWHDDLHLANIIVDPVEPTKILGLIDWQSTEISPLYFHARQPHFMDYDGPPINGLERPQLREDLDELEPSEREKANTLYLQQSLCSLYNTLIHRQNPRLYASLQFQRTQKYLLLVLARNILIDGEASYLAQVAELESTWDEFSGKDGSSYPFTFSEKERQELETDVEGVARGMNAMRSIKESLGELFPEQGIVKPEEYEEALDALSQIKTQVIDEFATNEVEKEEWEKMWPFGT
ncbi:kinase-like domain-containing protein [Phaeosphaeria sp. MPI-PUGE-AT-0046c]|nr:kinase-like domain-containing protein [Phaeosphaeria sp. MPI-PUGE-AT-0046c]